MRHIVLISCGKKKSEKSGKAEDLYVGVPFRKTLAYARLLSPDAIYILSAKHGLLSLGQIIEPYEQTLKGKSKSFRQAWSNQVLNALASVCDLNADRFTILAGKNYCEFLTPGLHNSQFPLHGLNQGQRAHFLKEKLP